MSTRNKVWTFLNVAVLAFISRGFINLYSPPNEYRPEGWPVFDLTNAHSALFVLLYAVNLFATSQFAVAIYKQRGSRLIAFIQAGIQGFLTTILLWIAAGQLVYPAIGMQDTALWFRNKFIITFGLLAFASSALGILFRKSEPKESNALWT